MIVIYGICAGLQLCCYTVFVPVYNWPIFVAFVFICYWLIMWHFTCS